MTLKPLDAKGNEDPIDVATYVQNALDERWNRLGPTYKTWEVFYDEHIEDKTVCSLDKFKDIR